jgi:hypothetical protein
MVTKGISFIEGAGNPLSSGSNLEAMGSSPSHSDKQQCSCQARFVRLIAWIAHYRAFEVMQLSADTVRGHSGHHLAIMIERLCPFTLYLQ